jgi:hypothetical protein
MNCNSSLASSSTSLADRDRSSRSALEGDRDLRCSIKSSSREIALVIIRVSVESKSCVVSTYSFRSLHRP